MIDYQLLAENVKDDTVLTLRMTCESCGTRFRFKGLPVGRSLTEASMSPDGFTCALPVIPVAAKAVIHARSFA
jgi:hypothetical protein